jgi:hypothetical protein
MEELLRGELLDFPSDSEDTEQQFVDDDLLDQVDRQIRDAQTIVEEEEEEEVSF